MKLLYQHAPGLPVTHVSLLLPETGACLDPPELQGLSRLITRMLFSGAGGLSNAEINGRLERLGASMGASLANDLTIPRLVTLTENLGPALELFLLSLREPNFDPEEFERLRAELLSGWFAEREEHKRLRAQEVYLHQLYQGAPTGYLPDGNDVGLRDSTLADARAHYETLSGGAAPLLAVLSDLSEAEVRERIAGRVEWPARPDGAAFPWNGFAPPAAEGRRITIVPEKDTNTDELILGAFSAAETEPDWHIHRLIAYIFGGDMNSRMFRAIRGDRGLSYGASCWYETSRGRAPRNRVSPFSMYTFPAAEHTAEALPLLISLYEELVEQGVSEEEVALARQALIQSHPFQTDTPEKLLGLEITRALYGLENDEEETHRAKFEGITPGDVHEVLRKSHHPGRLDMVFLGDPARLEPLAAKVAGVESMETRPYPASTSTKER